ncbi:MAG: hypothetical protein K6G50_04400, partial [bacterium]|nr:hypothetical protein [bacterium]
MNCTSPQTLRQWLAAISLVLASILLAQSVCWADESPNACKCHNSCCANALPAGSLSRDGYVLEQAVVLSRHNIRSPLSGSGSNLGKITPHQW